MLRTLFVLLAILLAFGVVGRLDYDIAAAGACERPIRMAIPETKDRNVYDSPLAPDRPTTLSIVGHPSGRHRHPITKRET